LAWKVSQRNAGACHVKGALFFPKLPVASVLISVVFPQTAADILPSSVFSDSSRSRRIRMSDEVTRDPTLPSPDEAEQDLLWMRHIAAGDMTAFEQLIEAHQTRVIGTVAKMLGDDTDAEDIAQQVFIRVWKSAGRYQPTAKFTTWLFKITRNLVFNEMRRRKRHPAKALNQEEEERHFQAADASVMSPDASMLDTEMQAAIQAAIESLPETQRMAIILRRYEDTPYEEIGEILGLSVPAVKSVLFRARAELKEKLRKYLES
jgi:RNA polymerase sigma-70 factor (ECF subfamily)